MIEELRIFIVSITMLFIIVSGGCIIKRMLKKRDWLISRILMVGFFFAAFIWCLGEQVLANGENTAHVVKDVLLAIQCTMQVFTINVGYEDFKELTTTNIEIVSFMNQIYTSVLLAFAPILTASVILSFFNEAVVWFKLFFSRRKEIYVFSELNGEAISLARSCKEKSCEMGKKALIIFTDVDKEHGEHSAEMLEEVQALDGVCTKKDILSVEYFIRLPKNKRKKRETCEFFIIGKNDEENMKHASGLLRKYHGYSNVNVYLFSESEIVKLMVTSMIECKNKELQESILQKLLKEVIEEDGKFNSSYMREQVKNEKITCEGLWKAIKKELLENEVKKKENIKLTGEDRKKRDHNVEKAIKELEQKVENKKKEFANRKSLKEHGMKMTLRCINYKQNLIYNYLYTHNLFKEIYTDILSIGIVGDATYARELIKGMLWYGQMKEYELRIHVFDEDGSLEEYFKRECAELLEKNNDVTKQEAKYNLRFYKCKPGSEEYESVLKKIDGMTHFYFMYENEEKNLEEGIHASKVIKWNNKENNVRVICLTKNSIGQEIVEKESEKIPLKNYKGKDYDLRAIVKTWNYDIVYNRELEQKALDEHAKWELAERLNEKVKNMSQEEKDLIKSDKEDELYKYDYFYRSSIARVIRIKLRKELEIPGTDKDLKERSVEEKRYIREIEHRGWNAYMRGEGYRYSKERDDMLKTHQDLVPFYKLPLKEQEKDDD